MNAPASSQTTPPAPAARSGWRLFGIVFAAVFLAVGAVLLLAWWWLFPGPFQPVRLAPDEQQVLEQKLERLQRAGARLPDSPERGGGPRRDELDASGRLRPEPYREDPAGRDIAFSERELNALLASDPELARRMAIDLSDDLVSLKLLIPVPEDFPVLAGKTLRVRAGMTVRMKDGQPQFILRGVSVMGVPLPNAWLGEIKHRDLASEFGEGFWQGLARGIEDIEVREGRLRVRLRP